MSLLSVHSCCDPLGPTISIFRRHAKKAFLAYLTATAARQTGASAFRIATSSSAAFTRRHAASGSGLANLSRGTTMGPSAASTCRSSTSLASTMAAPAVPVMEAVSHPSYEVVQTDHITEFGANAILYKHKKTGAELLSLSTDGDNKCFGITFRTPPTDSTGVPHILEHSVLCGSRKYTTKDPFVQLLQGSLQTFLNAFTYPDRTCYVVASQNTKDFYNLINVYADAVFHPRAISDPMVHAQEGWHLELEKLEDDLTYKGKF